MGGTLLSFTVHLAFALTGLWAVAAVIGLAPRRASAALRHRVWALASLGSLLLPAAVWLLPERRVGPIHLPTTPAPILVATQTPVARDEVPSGSRFRDNAAKVPATFRHPSPQPTVEPDQLSAVTHAPAVTAPVRAPRPVRWTRIIAFGWLLPALWLGARLVVSLIAVARQVRRSRPLDGTPATERFGELMRGLGVRRAPSLREMDGLASPLCVGVIRPAVLLPAEWPTWPPERLDAVLTHELAHVARRDVPWQLVARVACAAYWPHPLAWAAAWRMRVERELACDDWVLRRGQSPTRYAHWLLDVAAALTGGREPAGAVAMAAGRNGLERRIVALLDARRRRLPLSRRAAVVMTVGAVGLLAVAGMLSPLSPGQPTAAKAATTPPATQAFAEPMRIRGLVEAAPGQPAVDARVVLDSHPGRVEGRTDPHGQFDFTIEGHKKYTASILVIGAEPTLRAAVLLRITDPTTRPTIETKLLLKHARSLPCTVKDAEGKPIAQASVRVNGSGIWLDETATDGDGRASLLIPSDAELFGVIAEKARAGLDYFRFQRAMDGTATTPYLLPQDFTGPIDFTLRGGTRRVDVQVVDGQGRALSGVRVNPRSYLLPRKGGEFFTSGEIRTTGADGLATFDNVPGDDDHPILFEARRDGYCALDRCEYDPKKHGATTQAALYPMVRVTGDVTDASGRPAPGARVNVSGEGYHFQGFSGRVITDAAGTFAIDVNPQMYYLFVAEQTADHLASPAALKVIRDAAPAEAIHLKLQRATRVFGRVTGGPEGAPVAGVGVFIQQDDDSYNRLAKGEQFPGGILGRRAILPMTPKYATSAADGSFEFYVGPEKYTLYAPGQPGQGRGEELVVTGEPAIEHDLHLTQSKNVEPMFIRGRVVLRDHPEIGVADATITGQDVEMGVNAVKGASDRTGRFTIGRGWGVTYVYAQSPDGKLAGIIEVNPNAQDVTLPVGPTSSAAGQLLDADGKPARDRQIEYGVHVGSKNAGFVNSFGGSVQTGPDGRFAVNNLVPGYVYPLGVVTKWGDEGVPAEWFDVAEAKVEREGERVDLGRMRLPQLHDPPTFAERTRATFDHKEPFEERLAKANQTARDLYQNVLIILGSPDRLVCEQLVVDWFNVEDDTVAVALADYAPVWVDANGPGAEAAKEWARRVGVEWPSKGMALVALDADGKVRWQATDADLSESYNIDRRKVIEFAKAHAPALPDAQHLLDEALAQAKREHKRVLLDQSGAYCGWCVKLAEYVHGNWDLLGKDFVYVTLDTRFGHGEEVIGRLRPKGSGGVPWIAILDADGKVLITSDGPDGNIGFPAEAGGQAHWEKMLRATATHLSDADIRQLIDKLKTPANAGKVSP